MSSSSNNVMSSAIFQEHALWPFDSMQVEEGACSNINHMQYVVTVIAVFDLRLVLQLLYK